MAKHKITKGDLDRIQESTETITAGMSDPINWILLIGSIIGIPFTGGLSIGLAILALMRMTDNGRANLQAIQPAAADIAAPGYGCLRIIGALGVLLLMLAIISLFLLVLWANATGMHLR